MPHSECVLLIAGSDILGEVGRTPALLCMLARADVNKEFCTTFTFTLPQNRTDPTLLRFHQRRRVISIFSKTADIFYPLLARPSKGCVRAHPIGPNIAKLDLPILGGQGQVTSWSALSSRWLCLALELQWPNHSIYRPFDWLSVVP